MSTKRHAVHRTLAVAGIVIIAMSGAVDATASTPRDSAAWAGAHQVRVLSPGLGTPFGGVRPMCLACVE